MSSLRSNYALYRDTMPLKHMICSFDTQSTSILSYYRYIALRRNVPEIQCVESDCLLVSQSLKQLEVTNSLYYEDDDRCTSASKCL